MPSKIQPQTCHSRYSRLLRGSTSSSHCEGKKNAEYFSYKRRPLIVSPKPNFTQSWQRPPVTAYPVVSGSAVSSVTPFLSVLPSFLPSKFRLSFIMFMSSTLNINTHSLRPHFSRPCARPPPLLPYGERGIIAGKIGVRGKGAGERDSKTERGESAFHFTFLPLRC